MSRDLVRAGSGDDAAVLQGVLHGSKAVADGVLHLDQRVLVGALEQNGDGQRVLALFDEGELVLAQNVFGDLASVAEDGLVEVFEAGI